MYQIAAWALCICIIIHDIGNFTCHWHFSPLLCEFCGRGFTMLHLLPYDFRHSNFHSNNFSSTVTLADYFIIFPWTMYTVIPGAQTFWRNLGGLVTFTTSPRLIGSQAFRHIILLVILEAMERIRPRRRREWNSIILQAGPSCQPYRCIGNFLLSLRVLRNIPSRGKARIWRFNSP